MSKPNEPSLECQQFEAEWNRALDDRSSLQNGDLDGHARDCRRCRALLRGAKLLESYCWEGNYQPSQNFATKVALSLNAQSITEKRRKKYRNLVGSFAIAASALIAVYFFWPTTKKEIEVVQVVAPAPAESERERIIKEAPAQWQQIGTDVAQATRQAASTPLSLPSKLFNIKPLRESETIQSLEPITLVFSQVGESARDSLEPIAKSAELSMKQWWKNLPKQ